MNLSGSLFAVIQDSSPQKKGSSETGANDLDSQPLQRKAAAKITISRQVLMGTPPVDPLGLNDPCVLLMQDQRKFFIFETVEEIWTCIVSW
jgi:hypothetical protein